MNVIIEPKHLLQAHRDTSFVAWLNKVPQPVCPAEPPGSDLPKVSGRALRGLLLNAPTYEPACGTDTFEAIAREYTPTRLFDIYHAFVKDDPDCWDGVCRNVIFLNVTYKHRRVSMESVIALLYILISIKASWMLTGATIAYLDYLIGVAAKSILKIIGQLKTLAGKLDPLRYTYTLSYADGSKPDELIVIVDARVYAEYLAEGYTDDMLVEQARVISENTHHVRVVKDSTTF